MVRATDISGAHHALNAFGRLLTARQPISPDPTRLGAGLIARISASGH
jgi:hypothetical protein